VARGIDYAWARPTVAALKGAGITFASRYLSYDNTGKNLSRAEADYLINGGIPVVCNWEWTEHDGQGGYAQGVTYAREAARQQGACGIPGDRPIYFSCDTDVQPWQFGTYEDYFRGIASVIGHGRVGVYGGYYFVKAMADSGVVNYVWQTYAWSNGNWDSRAHVRQTIVGGRLGGLDVDYDESMIDDIGQHPAPGHRDAIVPVTAGPWDFTPTIFALAETLAKTGDKLHAYRDAILALRN
jgi:Domain of unknown function (DUF1906)